MSDLLVVESIFSKHNRIKKELIDHAKDQDAQAQALEKTLKDLDPRLIVRFIRQIPPDVVRHGIRENRWHIIREAEHENEYEPYLPIIGPNGEFKSPESKVADDMKKADLWKEGALDRLFAEREKQSRKLQADAELKRSQLADEMALAYRAAKRVRGDDKLLKEAAPKKAV